jgi:hypothetical protein
MGRTAWTLAAALVAAASSTALASTSGTCTITDVAPGVAAGGPGPQKLLPIAEAVGVAMPVTFDEATGAFSMSQDVWASMFGSAGATSDTGFGGHATEILIMPPGTVTGTIDAAGNITLPSFPFTFGTDYCPAPNNRYPVVANLDSAPQFLTLGPAVTELHGAALDFATGLVTLVGGGKILGTCATGPIITFLTLTCRMNPVPDKAKLPPAPALLKLQGSAAIGKPLPATPPSKPDKGDVLTLDTTVVPGVAGKLDFTANTFIRLADPTGTDLVVVEAPAGTLSAKGKSFQVLDRPPGKNGTDPDGAVIQVLMGQKATGTVTAATAGLIRFTPGKKGVKLKATLQGLDLSTLTGSGELAVAVGPYTATAPFTVTGKGRHLRLR